MLKRFWQLGGIPSLFVHRFVPSDSAWASTLLLLAASIWVIVGMLALVAEFTRTTRFLRLQRLLDRRPPRLYLTLSEGHRRKVFIEVRNEGGPSRLRAITTVCDENPRQGHELSDIGKAYALQWEETASQTMILGNSVTGTLRLARAQEYNGTDPFGCGLWEAHLLGDRQAVTRPRPWAPDGPYRDDDWSISLTIEIVGEPALPAPVERHVTIHFRRAGKLELRDFVRVRRG